MAGWIFTIDERFPQHWDIAQRSGFGMSPRSTTSKRAPTFVSGKPARIVDFVGTCAPRTICVY